MQDIGPQTPKATVRSDGEVLKPTMLAPNQALCVFQSLLQIAQRVRLATGNDIIWIELIILVVLLNVHEYTAQQNSLAQLGYSQ